MRTPSAIRRIALILVVCALGFAGSASFTSVSAQDGTPVAAECVAPELPPGTPTPMEASPEAAEETEEMEMPEGTPEGEEAPESEGPPAMPEGVAADEAATAAATAGLENLVGCLNSGMYLEVGALMTDSFITDFIGVPTVYDVPSTFEDAQALELMSAGNVLAYDDGSVSVDIVFTGFFGGPGAIGSERWFFVVDGDTYRIANITPNPVPAGTLPGALEVDIAMVDYAFSMSQYTIPANTPVIFHLSNNSFTMTGHVAVVLTCGDATSEQLLTGEVDGETACQGFFGAQYLEPGQTGDLIFTGLEPGKYILICDVENPSGVPHNELGMVAEFVVE